MADAEFLDLVDGSSQVTATFVALWSDAMHRVVHAEAAENVFRLAALAFEQGFGMGLTAVKRLPKATHPIW